MGSEAKVKAGCMGSRSWGTVGSRVRPGPAWRGSGQLGKEPQRPGASGAPLRARNHPQLEVTQLSAVFESNGGEQGGKGGVEAATTRGTLSRDFEEFIA